MKTKTFTSFMESTLDRKIATFLKSNDVEVIDIKFSYGIFFLAAMIIYK